ncbi:MAG TPA: FAD-binding protein, partial [Anaerolineaceae bacterium]|nr:FAD-binding protein [Anaerolineaceae bacterium]
MSHPSLLPALRNLFGSRLQENVTLANYTTARVGGSADALMVVYSTAELAEVAGRMWTEKLPFHILGSGSNVLISDAGVRGLVILNHAHGVRVEAAGDPPTVWAESGANFSAVARQVALRGLSGLEWAAAIPGTVGGAVYGNAGAFGSNIQHDLVLAEILHREQGRQTWTVDQFEYDYRSSILKREPGQA